MVLTLSTKNNDKLYSNSAENTILLKKQHVQKIQFVNHEDDWPHVSAHNFIRVRPRTTQSKNRHRKRTFRINGSFNFLSENEHDI